MTDASASNGNRAKVLTILTVVFVIGAVVWGGYWFLFLRNTESTDDAYVSGHLVTVTAQVSGTVIAVGADDTNAVKVGQMLVRLDGADAQVGLEQAESQLAKMVRQVRNTQATVAQLQATVDMRRSDVARARDDLERRRRLVQSGAISEEELRHAAETLRGAEAALISAERQTAATGALVDGTDLAHHPDVENAAAKVRDAYLMLSRTAIPAPVSGTVARRSVQVGSRVSPGVALMSVVSLDQVWVDANFKESQLASMRIGQPAAVTADLYGSKVTYHGKVEGFGAGTGSAFALLPAQNATGNWVKVVQRVPVRIALDPKELAEHPLAIGLSMGVEVDTADRSGARGAAPVAVVTETKVFDDLEGKANARIAAIIAANMGQVARN
jgi:membrane fusion protein (multidrug efflux system)